MKKKQDYSSYPNSICLEAELLHEPKYPGSAFLIFDFDVEAIFGSKGRIPVIMTIDGKRFHRNLAKYAGEYMMVFNKELRDETGYKAGDKIQILLHRDFAERVIELPGDILEMLRAAGVLPAWEKQSYSQQKEHLAWILEAKKDETKQRRINKIVDTLKRI
jgi:hypothetical protein